MREKPVPRGRSDLIDSHVAEMIVPALGCLAFIFHRTRTSCAVLCFLKIGPDVICKLRFASGAGKVILAPFVPLDLECLARLMGCGLVVYWRSASGKLC